MVYRENYETDIDSARQWLEELQPFIKHAEFNDKDLRTSALIVIDMQDFFLEESSHACVPAARSIIPKINELIKVYNDISQPIIFTRYAVERNEDPGVMARWWKETLYDDSPESELSSQLFVPPDSTIIKKSTYDSFQKTDLKNILNKNSVGTVVITGVMTHLCCETTARSAFVNDFMVYFVVDANATVNKELHLASLKTLSDGFAVPCTTAGLKNAIETAFDSGDRGEKV
jgi:isochorismate hydrolase